MVVARENYAWQFQALPPFLTVSAFSLFLSLFFFFLWEGGKGDRGCKGNMSDGASMRWIHSSGQVRIRQVGTWIRHSAYVLKTTIFMLIHIITVMKSEPWANLVPLEYLPPKLFLFTRYISLIILFLTGQPLASLFFFFFFFIDYALSVSNKGERHFWSTSVPWTWIAVHHPVKSRR